PPASRKPCKSGASAGDGAIARRLDVPSDVPASPEQLVVAGEPPRGETRREAGEEPACQRALRLPGLCAASGNPNKKPGLPPADRSEPRARAACPLTGAGRQCRTRSR